MKAILVLLLIAIGSSCPCKIQAHGTEWLCEPKTCHEAGSISLRHSNATKLNLDGVTSLKELDLLGNANLEMVTLPDVTWMVNMSVVNNSKLAGINAPKLTDVENMWVGAKELAFLALERTKAIRIVGTHVESIKLPSLNHTGILLINDNPKLKMLLLTSLTLVENHLGINNNAQLATVTIEHSKWIRELYVDENPALKTITIPDDPYIMFFEAVGNKALTLISMSHAKNISEFKLYGNPELDKIEVPALRYTGEIRIENAGMKTGGCLHLTCLIQNPLFIVPKCGQVVFKPPLCANNVTWDCKCK